MPRSKPDPEPTLEERLTAEMIALTDEYNATGHKFVELGDATARKRAEIDRMVAETPGSDVRHDGPPAMHGWEAHHRDLKRTMRTVPKIAPPLPRWAYMTLRREQDATHKRMRLLRLRKRTDEEQAQLDELNAGLSFPGPFVNTID